jgi:NADH-quinone oxidoreductase subunit F
VDHQHHESLGLRGRGGAGFPTGMKWSFVPKVSEKPKYILVNGDESEPGTCKDHLVFREDPHAVIEGTIIAGLAIGSKMGFIYLRGEYRYLLNIVEKAVADAYAKGFLGKNIFGNEGVDFDIITQTGAGAYEVGEESALMESLEGKRGIPRIKPSVPRSRRPLRRPHRHQQRRNHRQRPAHPPHGRRGLRQARHRTQRRHAPLRHLGHVERPGVYELPMGYSLRKAIYDVAGGIKGGKQLKAVVPGGASCPILRADEIDVGLDFDQMAKAGTMLGSGGIVVSTKPSPS